MELAEKAQEATMVPVEGGVGLSDGRNFSTRPDEAGAARRGGGEGHRTINVVDIVEGDGGSALEPGDLDLPPSSWPAAAVSASRRTTQET